MMRILVAGATGVIGIRLVPLLVQAGHTVFGLTRTPAKRAAIEAQGAEPVVCDALDTDSLDAAVLAIAPDMIIDELTDLPDDQARIQQKRPAHNRIRREGIRNLVAAAHASGTSRLLSQSIAWTLTGDAQAAVEEHERRVLDAGGVLLRYGQFYGPGTFYPHEQPPPPAVHVAEAARRTVDALDAPAGSILTIVD
jgi:nucleoside-diphosphate-sugar epimerase